MPGNLPLLALAWTLAGTFICPAQADEPQYAATAEHQVVFRQLKTCDSLLFSLGFNRCDTPEVNRLVSEDFEFYHDQAGMMTSKASFVRSIAGLRKLPYKPIRELDRNSLEVHLLKNNGELYGAIQRGTHRFYAERENQPRHLTSTASFTHVWILEDDNWKLTRVLSFDHHLVLIHGISMKKASRNSLPDLFADPSFFPCSPTLEKSLLIIPCSSFPSPLSLPHGPRRCTTSPQTIFWL